MVKINNNGRRDVGYFKGTQYTFTVLIYLGSLDMFRSLDTSTKGYSAMEYNIIRINEKSSKPHIRWKRKQRRCSCERYKYQARPSFRFCILRMASCHLFDPSPTPTSIQQLYTCTIRHRQPYRHTQFQHATS